MLCRALSPSTPPTPLHPATLRPHPHPPTHVHALTHPSPNLTSHILANALPVCRRLLDNIGARRLHTVLERVLSDISFGAPEKAAAAKAEGKDA